MAKTKVSRMRIEQEARDYLERVSQLGGGSRNGRTVPDRSYQRALNETIQAKERIIRARGDEIID